MHKNPKPFWSEWWLSVSIRSKLLIFIGMVVLMVLSITIFSIGMVRIYLRDFNVVLGDSYAVNQVLSGFGQEHTAFKEYANHRTEEQWENYAAARRQTTIAVTKLRFDYQKMGINRYLLTQAIRVAYQSYLDKCDETLRLYRESEVYIKEYYNALKIGGYLEEYIKHLMQETLAEGNENYYKKVELFRILPVIASVMGSIIIIFALLLCSITVRHIITPVLRLADTAKEIAVQHFEVADVQVENRDEIGTLVHTFNSMKHSMADSIHTLQEKNEMEGRLHQEEVQRINVEQALQTAQLSLLQSQINPHFLFNTLNTISRMAKIEDAGCTAELIQRLANLFRYNLQTASEQVTLTRELNIINDYIYIQHKRFGTRIGFVVDCTVDGDTFMIPTFTLQPLVENAVIHGVSPKEEGGRIRIRIRQREQEMHITITDSGCGMPPERLNALLSGSAVHRGHLSGIGLGNVRTRIAMLYPQSRFSIFSRVGLGTCIRIALPVQS